MPGLNAFVEWGNELGNRWRIDEVQPELFAPGTEFVDSSRALGAADRIGGGVAEQALRFLSGMPPSLREGIRAVIYSALTRQGSEARPSVQFAWAPAYDFELTVWESAASGGSRGSITVFVRSPYPSA